MSPVKQYMRGQILRLAWPVVLEMFGIMAVSLLVTVMVGDFGPVALAAVGLSTLVQFATAMIFAAAGTGAAAIVARETGAGNWDEVRSVAGQALLLGLLFGIGLAVSGFAVAPYVFGLTGAEPEVAGLAGNLLRISCLFTPLYLLLAIGNSILRGMGQTKVAFGISSLSNGIALIIGYMLIYGRGLPGIGPYGAAWATGLCQGIGGILVLIVLASRPRIDLRVRDIFTIRPVVMKRILAVSVPAALEQLALQGGRIVYTFMLANVGAVQFAAHQIAMQIESISFMPGFGFSVAAMTLVGQYLGMGMPHRAAQYAWLTNKISFWSMTGMGVVFFLFATQLAGVFIDDPEVVHWGTLCVMIAALEQPTLALNYVFGGALRGAGDTKWPMYTTTTGVWLIRMPLAYLFISVWHYPITAAWYITASDFLIRSLILGWRFSSNKWQLAKV
jgi:putative MATE family efflux protein